MKRLVRASRWINVESRCENRLPSIEDGDQAVASHNQDHPRPAAKADCLRRYLKLYPPGQPPHGELDADSAPLLLAITRHRRIPINWQAAMDEGSVLTPSDKDPTQNAIESMWLLAADMFARIPTAAHDPRSGDRFRIRQVAIGSPKRFFDERPLPSDVLLVQSRITPASSPSVFALLPKPGQVLTPTEARWTQVAEIVEVFPATQPGDEGAEALSSRLSGILSSAFDGRIQDAFSIAGISSRIPVETFAARLVDEYRASSVAGLIDENVVKFHFDDEHEKRERYWIIDASKKEDVLRDAQDRNEQVPFVCLRQDGKSDESRALVELEERCWILKAGDRRYKIVTIHGSPLDTTDAPPDLRNATVYKEAWKSSIAGLLPLAWSPAKYDSPEYIPYSYLESVDLAPHLIVDEFSRLKIELDISASTSALGDAILAKIPTMTESEVSDVNLFAQHVRDYKANQFSIEWKIRALKARAEKLGYHLATGLVDGEGHPDDQFEVPKGAGAVDVTKIKQGRLYVKEERTAAYTIMKSQAISHFGVGVTNPFSLSPTIPIPGSSGLLGFGRRRSRRDYPVEVSVRYMAYREVPLSAEPWEAKRRQLQDAGFQCVVADLTENGYVDEGGTPVRELLARARIDEVYRAKLALFLPIHQERLDVGLAKVRYLISIRPEPGFQSLGFPRVYCEEEIAYRAQWRGHELGEVLHSVSLAPGEERSVTITRTIDQKTERVDSINSVLDVTQSQRDDLQTSLQNTVSREKNSKKSSNWNVKASASIGAFSGGGGGGGSQEESIRDFAESIKKSAMQSTQELRLQRRQEIKSSTTTSTSVATTESTQTKFSNINQGRTLNLFFYQVANVFDAGLFLEKLRLAYTPSVELVEGTGVYDTITLELSGLADLVSLVCRDEAFRNGDVLFDLPTVEKRVLRSAIKSILTDYVSIDELKSDHGESLPSKERRNSLMRVNGAAVAISDAIPFLENLMMVSTSRSALAASMEEESVAVECQRYTRVLSNLYGNGQIIVPHTLVAPSTATYIDSIVGCSPSTEPYSEEMRDVEIESRKADVELKRANSARANARALRQER